MFSRKRLSKLVTFLSLIGVISFVFLAASAEETGSQNIVISPLNITPDQKVTVALEDIKQDSLINLSLNASVKTTPGQEMDYTINDFLFPYESGNSVFQAEMLNLEPGTPATVSILREDGTEASRTDNVSEIGRFNASIQRELNRGMYNVSFIGIPASPEIQANIDFGGMTKASAGPSTEAATTESVFTPGGINDGTIEVKVYIDYELQKEDTITISSEL
jgi:hypothetical protein